MNPSLLSTKTEHQGKHPSNSIAIIGAGLTGLMCALHLSHHHFNVEIYERRSHEEIPNPRYKVAGQRGRSMSMDISARGIYALKAVDVFDCMESDFVPMKYKITHDYEGNQKFLPYSRFDHENILTISRTGLYQALLNQCRRCKNISIHFRHRLLDINFEDRIAIIADEISDTTKVIAPEIIIGADGVNSSVRSIIQHVGGLHFDISYFPMSYKELSIPTHCAKNFYLYAMHTWPRYNMMLVAQPNLDLSFTCALLMKELDNQLSFTNIDTPNKIRSVFDKHFSDASKCMPNLESEYQNNPIGKLKIVMGKAWTFRDFVLLLGDAAHAMVPFFGQGVNCCFEDCTFLSEALDRHGNHWPTVFREIDRVRVPNANAINSLSYENYPELFANSDMEKIQLIKEIEVFLSERYSDRFRTYHNLICFDRVPYSTAQRVKAIQTSLLERLSSNIDSIDEIDPRFMDSQINDYMQQFTLITKGESS